jgi:hypothetical protein
VAMRGRQWRWMAAIVVTCATAVSGGFAASPWAAAAGTSVAAHAAAPTADGLIARLAILRRPQTPADTLPAHAPRLPAPAGRIIPSLTRLVATLPGVNLYLVVSMPSRGALALWSPRLGDQASIVAVGHLTFTQSLPFPAVDLDDPLHLASVETRAAGNGAVTARLAALIVPDGISQVRWAVTGWAGKPGPTQAVPVSNNVAVVHLAPNEFPGRTTWHAADGSVVPTSEQAIRRALAHRRVLVRRGLIRSIERHPHRAAPGLLAGFAVFRVTSRSPMREPGGLTIWRPRLAQLPMIVLSMLTQPHSGQLDFRQIRAVVTRSGARLWVIPGAHGMCLATAHIVRGSGPVTEESGGGACTPSLAQAESQGTGFSEGYPGGVSTSYGVQPLSKPTVTLRINGRRRTLQPPFGIYAVRTATGHHRGGSKSVVVVGPAK